MEEDTAAGTTTGTGEAKAPTTTMAATTTTTPAAEAGETEEEAEVEMVFDSTDETDDEEVVAPPPAPAQAASASANKEGGSSSSNDDDMEEGDGSTAGGTAAAAAPAPDSAAAIAAPVPEKKKYAYRPPRMGDSFQATVPTFGSEVSAGAANKRTSLVCCCVWLVCRGPHHWQIVCLGLSNQVAKAYATTHLLHSFSGLIIRKLIQTLLFPILFHLPPLLSQTTHAHRTRTTTKKTAPEASTNDLRPNQTSLRDGLIWEPSALSGKEVDNYLIMTRGLVEQTSHTRDRHEPRWRRPGVSSSGVPLTAEQEAAAAAAAAAGGGTGDLIPLEADEQALFYLYQQKYNLDMTSLRLTSELGMRKGTHCCCHTLICFYLFLSISYSRILPL